MSKAPVRKVRCAIYTRKSSEEGLEQEFNSLQAQREACEAYIASQRHEGWVLVPHRYDDGGVSGGTLERPALKRLLADVEAGRIDVVVVYKVDRLTRSLMDFAKLVDVFERNRVSFVSITQQFNTTTSMGRLTLNILLSFAQFEREITAERIRDKFRVSRQKGMWMGGHPPLGYDVRNRKLVVNEAEAELVRHIFRRFVILRSATGLVKELNAEGRRTKSWVTAQGRAREGRPFDKGYLYRLLNNRVYLGEAVHKGIPHPGEHEAIVPRDLWDKVHAILSEHWRVRAARSRAATPAPLKGLIRCALHGCAMTPTHTRKRGKQYRYYACVRAAKTSSDACPLGYVPAGEIESAVIAQVRALLRTPEMVARTLRAVRATADENAPSREETIEALQQIDKVWEELFPAEQTRILHLLVERLEVGTEGVDLRLRAEGLHSVVAELRDVAPPPHQDALPQQAEAVT
ncbi:MAG TPA: recombinase family protein [Xanthobacteraceae bacterium]|nr:recombinase family protein [Xanthobacteraceae bacterium]